MNYNYRPDIDGLRAISVLLVLFFHAGLFGIKAGFVGVDVFFVISGFLITTGIKNGLEKGNFSFIEFFKRRLWRLQPVFITLLLVTTIVTTISYLPDDYLAFTKSAKWAVRFQANRYFADLDSGYFADDTSIMPLLHTWSLSIEWQWYLVLPFLMFGFYRILKIKKMVYWVFPLTIIAIVIPFFFIEDRNNSAYYYSFSSRIFEMLIGSCLAAVGSKGVEKIPAIAKTLLGTVCLGVIIYAGFSEKIINSYPNWWAVGVCISAALLIYLGNDKNLITKILSWKPLVFIGILSYSLYIWHWPVFAFASYYVIDDTIHIKFLCLLLSFILAFVSLKFIETPLRKLHKIGFVKSLFLLILIPYTAIHFIDNYNKKNAGIPDRLGEKLIKVISISNDLKEHSNKIRGCIDFQKENKQNINVDCYFGDSQSSKTLLLIGDSFSNHSIGMMDILTKGAKVKMYSLATGSCLALPDIYLTGGFSEPNKMVYQSCFDNTKKYYQLVENNHYDYVVLGQIWSSYINTDDIVNKLNDERSIALSRIRIEKALSKAIDTIVESGATPVIIKGPYAGDRKTGKRFARVGIRNEKYLDKYNILLNPKDQESQKWFDSVLEKIRTKHHSLVVIDQQALHCDNEKCKVELNEHPIFQDDGVHLTDYASYQFGKLYLERYGNPFK